MYAILNTGGTPVTDIIYPTFRGARIANTRAVNGNAGYQSGIIHRVTTRRRFADGELVLLVDADGQPVTNSTGRIHTYLAGSSGLVTAMARLGGTPVGMTFKPLTKREQAVLA